MRIQSPFRELKELRRWWQGPDTAFALWALVIVGMTAAIAVVMTHVLLYLMSAPPMAPGVPSFHHDLWSPSVAFVCGVVPFAILSGRVYWGAVVAMIVYGATFWVWGVFASAVPTGMYGVPHAFLTAAVLGLTTRSWLPAAASIGAIAVTSLTIHVMPDRYSSMWIEIISVMWNTTVAAAMGLWCLWARQRARVLRMGDACDCCLYDLKGNATGTCPECGTRVSVAGSGEVSSARSFQKMTARQDVREVQP